MCSSSLLVDSARRLSLQSVGSRLSKTTWIDTTCNTVSAMNSNQCYNFNCLMPLVERRSEWTLTVDRRRSCWP